MWKGDRMKTISGIEFASEHNGTDVFRLIELAYEQGWKDGHSEQLGTNLAEVGRDCISRQHTFNGLYEQRMILFAALVKAYKDKAWKSYRHEDGEYCFGGGWFIVGIDTPEGSYTYHYENKYWDMFDCVDLPRAKHWDGHTEADAETRLMSLNPEPHWMPVTERLPEKDGRYLVTNSRIGAWMIDIDLFLIGNNRWRDNQGVTAWMPLPEPFKGVTDGRN